MNRDNKLQYILLYLLAVISSAAGSMLVRACPFSDATIAFYRMLFAVPLLLPFALTNKVKIAKKDYLLLTLSGLIFGVCIILLNTSVNLTTVANCNLFMNMWVFLTIPGAYFLFKDKLPRYFRQALILAAIGVLLLYFGKSAATVESGASLLGDTMGLGAAVAYAGYMLITYRVRDRVPAMVAMFYCSLGALVLTFFGMVSVEGIAIPNTGRDLLMLFLMSLVSQCLCMGLITIALGHISAFAASTLSMMQPAVAALGGFLVFQEVISPLEIAGILTTMAGVFLAQLKGKSRLSVEAKADSPVLAEK